MTTQYGRVVRWSLALTSVVAAVAVVLCAALGGSKGAYGALIGVGVVTVFFGISIIVVGRAARVSPMAMMVAALGTPAPQPIRPATRPRPPTSRYHQAPMPPHVAQTSKASGMTSGISRVFRS